MRIFIAIELSPEIKARVAQIIERLNASSAAVKWSRPENLHLTLKFIGEIEEEKLKKVKEILEGSVSKLKPFSISLEELGTFPEGRNPRVIWIGVKEGQEQICTIMQALNNECTKVQIGESEDREPVAHLTLGRVKDRKSLDKLVGLIEKYKEEKFGAEEVKEIAIIKSQLTPKGSIYTKVALVRL